ncbi:MAG: DUF542 domain-containing protein [Deltaproteobacteria bacterium]|nr:DUF542 domain-containing protein [Deltaproteobacteria bacterium]
MLDVAKPVGELVLESPQCADVLAKYHIDYCCRGHLTLAEACEKIGLDPQTIATELQAAIDRVEPRPVDPRNLTTPDLLHYIQVTYHDTLRDALPRLMKESRELAKLQKGGDPRFDQLDQTIQALGDLLLPHLGREEHELFPLAAAGNLTPQLRRELAAMRREHEDVGRVLRHLTRVRLALGPAPLSSLFGRLEQLESDLRRHLHLEIHALAPRFVTQA